MKKILLVVVSIVVSMAFLGCGAAKLTPKEEKLINSKVYTQVNMWVYKGIVLGTNYKAGSFIPVNTEVSIKSINKKEIIFTYRGESVRFQNVPKYTKVAINGLLTRSFASSKLSLAAFDENTKKDILKGHVNVGMSKDAVLIARGFPPAHETLSLEDNVWKYWESRFNTITYEFDDDKVSKIID